MHCCTCAYLRSLEEFRLHVDAGLQLHHDGNVGSNSNVGNSVNSKVSADGVKRLPGWIRKVSQ